LAEKARYSTSQTASMLAERPGTVLTSQPPGWSRRESQVQYSTKLIGLAENAVTVQYIKGQSDDPVSW
jgi:hypothetical protein